MSTQKLDMKVALAPKLVLEPMLVTESCLDKQSLRAELRAAMDEIIALVIRQIDAVRFGAEPGVEKSLELQIAYARRRKDTLLGLYKSHLDRHSC